MKNNSDLRLKILSVIMAIFMWTFVINSTNPSVNKVFRSVPVIIRNQDELEKSGYTLIGANEKHLANIKLKGSRERLINLKAENIYASVDISDVREGIQSLKIDVDTPQGVTVDEIEPGQINLNIQKVLEKNLPVNYIIDDQIKDGKIVEVNELTPEEITVKGPASAINNVDRVEARINDESLLDGKVHNVDIEIIGKNDNPVDNVSISDEDINISFRVFETKTVKVSMYTAGTVARDYREVSRTFSPESIVIKGPESVIRDINEVQTKVININNIKETITGETRLNLPEAVEVYNGENAIIYQIEVERKPKTKPSSTTANKEEADEDNID